MTVSKVKEKRCGEKNALKYKGIVAGKNFENHFSLKLLQFTLEWWRQAFSGISATHVFTLTFLEL